MVQIEVPFDVVENTPAERQVVSDMLRGHRDILDMLGLS